MATRQSILGGDQPVFIDETVLQQGILPGVYLDETTGGLGTLHVVETLSATDTSGELGTLNVVETLHAADAPSLPAGPINLSFNSRRNAQDTSSISVVFDRTIAETMIARDTGIQGNHLSVSETMNAVSTATESTDDVFSLRVREILSGIDAVTTDNRFFANVIEHAGPMITTNFASVNGTFNVSVRERGSGMFTAARSTIKATLAVTETMTAEAFANQSLIPGVWDVRARDVLSVEDHPVDPETFASTGIYFWGYQWAYGVFDQLAVWCGGLDCGDHPVRADGSVFVPWQSDPDLRFTPAYLIDVSNRLSGDVSRYFGATACNIDLTTNTGMIRITVDLAIGLPYKSRLQTLRPNSVDLTHSPYGPSLAETRRLHQYGAQLANSQGLSIGTQEANLRPMIFTNARGDKYPISDLFTGVFWNLIDDDYDFDGMMLVEMFRPYPATIAALIGFMKTMDRE